MTIPHLVIKASAGAGKTYRLARRYISLLSAGIPPQEIIALTFSRKAAGEIFDAIIQALLKAGEGDHTAKILAQEINAPDFSSKDFRAILSQLLQTLDRLHISTIDSFTVGIARTFPLELGVPWNFNILEDEDAEKDPCHGEVLDFFFQHPDISENARHTFLEALKRATFGLEHKAIRSQCFQLVKKYHMYFLRVNDYEAWGNPERIWPGGSAWLREKGSVSPVRLFFGISLNMAISGNRP